MADTAEADLPPAAAAPLFKKRAKTNIRKRPATPPPASSGSESEYSSADENGGRLIKKRRKNTGAITASSAQTKSNSTNLEPTKFQADRSKHIEVTNDATKQSNWYDEGSADASLDSKNLLGTTRARPGAEGTYKGSANYQSFVQKNPNAPTRQAGPIKAPTNIRTITVTDFAPDVCKDYKQTGYCGFGDSCKFLHAREDYKQGWELDRDWEIGTKGKKLKGQTVASANRGANTDGEDDDDDDELLMNIPFACIICKKPYTNPIVTKCGHYFCEACALQRYRKNPSCAACGSSTNGVFNVAKNLKKLLDKKRERARKRREKAIEEGEEPSEDEEAEEE